MGREAPRLRGWSRALFVARVAEGRRWCSDEHDSCVYAGGVVYDPPPPEVGSMRLEPVMSGRDPEC